MVSIQNILVEQIKKRKALSIHDALEIALYTPDYGYYFNHKVLGRTGDFITAPEVSQLFGEIIGIWCAWQWRCFGNADMPIHLIELGPGRGTMMLDVLRILERVPELKGRFSISLVEICNILKTWQKQNLHKYFNRCSLYKKLADVPKKPCFTIILANEFFDALPIKQFIKGEERMIILDDKGNFAFDQKNGSISEICPENSLYCQMISQHLDPGVGLIIDYGDFIHSHNRMGDTLQAIANHKIVPVLDNLGIADISHQVDFFNLSQHFTGFTIYSQRDFLLSFGIEERLNRLLKNYAYFESSGIRNSVYRLIAPREMGYLFKVLAIKSF